MPVRSGLTNKLPVRTAHTQWSDKYQGNTETSESILFSQFLGVFISLAPAIRFRQIKYIYDEEAFSFYDVNSL